MFLYKHFVPGAKLDLLEDIRRNLTHVLGSKRSTGYFRRDFGLSEVGFRTPEEMVTILTQEIRENIRLYEQRVEVVDIDEEYDDDGNRVRLVVQLRLRGAKERLRLIVDLQANVLDVQPVEPKARP